MILGFLLAVALDQKVRFENTFRTIFLYPFAMSFIVTGLVWQWIMNPTLGLQKIADGIGLRLVPLRLDRPQRPGALRHRARRRLAIVRAGHGDHAGRPARRRPELWKATRIDGIPTWRVYLHIVIPILRPTIITASVLLAIAVVRVYELVLATTGGGPGISTEVPGKFIMDYLFGRANIGLATGGLDRHVRHRGHPGHAWLYYEYFREKPRAER